MNNRHLLQILLLLLTLGFALTPFFNQKPPLCEFRYESELGEHIGGGSSGRYGPSEASFSLTGNLHELTFALKSQAGYWNVRLTAPTGEKLHTGHYDSVALHTGYTGELPVLAVVSNGAECDTLMGSFIINQITTDTAGAVTALDVMFTQRCESATAPQLHGSIKYNVANLGQ